MDRWVAFLYGEIHILENGVTLMGHRSYLGLARPKGVSPCACIKGYFPSLWKGYAYALPLA